MLALLVVIVLGAPSLLYPFGRDQGEYAYIASAALEGRIVYRDIFNVKPPLTHIVHQLALLAFGHSMLAIRLLDLLWQAATAMVILLVVEIVYHEQWMAALAACLYALLHFSSSYWDTAQTDGFQSLPVALAMLAFVSDRRRERRWAPFVCGLGVGLAVLFKYPIGSILPPLVLLAAQPWNRLGRGRVALVLAGAAVPVLICVGELAREGALQDLLFIQLRYIPRYAAGVDGGDGYLPGIVRHLLLFRWHNLALLLSAVALAVEYAHAAGRRATSAILPVAC